MYGIVLFEVVQSVLIMRDAFSCFVYQYGNTECVLSYGDSWFYVVVMTALASGAVQSFFAVRIWGLSRSYVLVGIVILVCSYTDHSITHHII